MNIVYFILIIGIVVLIHEFGHYLSAKAAGIYVFEFSIGMGPKIFSWHRKNDETTYSIRLLPIGGYVMMAGEDTEDAKDKKIPKGQLLQDKSWWVRLRTMVAGVTMNYLLAIILFFIVALVVGAHNGGTYIADLTEGMPAYEQLTVGDEIVAINGTKIHSSDHLQLELVVANGSPITFTVKHQDNTYSDATITPVLVTLDNESNYVYGITLSSETEYGIWASIKYAFLKFGSLFYQMLLTVWYLIIGKVKISSLSGPVGIFTIVSEAAKSGLINIVYLTGYLSLNVGLINILPLPAFDGGHVLFLIIEKIKGSPVDPKVENIIHTIGFVLLLLFMLLITVNDIAHLF